MNNSEALVREWVCVLSSVEKKNLKHTLEKFWELQWEGVVLNQPIFPRKLIQLFFPFPIAELDLVNFSAVITMISILKLIKAALQSQLMLSLSMSCLLKSTQVHGIIFLVQLIQKVLTHLEACLHYNENVFKNRFKSKYCFCASE